MPTRSFRLPPAGVAALWVIILAPAGGGLSGALAAEVDPTAATTAVLSGQPPLPPPAPLEGRKFSVPAIPYAPRAYACAHAPVAPVIDGRLDELAWQAAPWTELFGDIEGPIRPAPRFRTRAKMLFDDRCFYVAAEMEEPDLWATYDRRDMVIYHENDFEVFIDPDGDTHEYYELELNALNTVWDLLLLRPYRDGGPAVNAWDIAGLKTAVHLDGTLNDPRDHDRGWSVEIALPWVVLSECAHRTAPPAEGDQWRVNFSRVEWQTVPRGTEAPPSLGSPAGERGYDKRLDPSTGRPFPEDNWTWSPQGLIAMHYPEMWGVVQFCGPAAESPAPSVRAEADAAARWALRLAYYAEKEQFERTGRYSGDPRELPGFPAGALDLRTTQSGFEITVPSADGRGTLHLRDDGRGWRTEP